MTTIFFAPLIGVLLLQIELFLRDRAGLQPSGWLNLWRRTFGPEPDATQRALRFVMVAGFVFVLWEGFFWSLLGKGNSPWLTLLAAAIWTACSCARLWQTDTMHRSWTVLAHFAFWSLVCGAWVSPFLFGLSMFVRLRTLNHRSSSRRAISRVD